MAARLDDEVVSPFDRRHPVGPQLSIGTASPTSVGCERPIAIETGSTIPARKGRLLGLKGRLGL